VKPARGARHAVGLELAERETDPGRARGRKRLDVPLEGPAEGRDLAHREAHHEGAIPAAGRERQGSWPEARALGYPRPRADRGGGPRRHDVARTDRRWLLAVAALLAAWLGVFVGAGAIYRATGPHPRVGTFLRRVQHHTRGLLHLRGRRGSR